ncbi:MAG: hypothetical protein ACRD3C_07590 [Vicinamibacterales bacterium]
MRVSDYFASGVPREGKADARGRADARTAETTDHARRAIVSRVLRAREASASTAQATKAKASIEDLKNDRLLVEDYKALCLWVDEIYAKENRTDLTTEAIRTKTEVRLRSAGIRPIDLLNNLAECTDQKGSDGRYLLPRAADRPSGT